MNLYTKLSLAVAAMALVVAPAAASATTYYNPPPKPPKTKTSPPPHAKAYGFHCKGFSKKHVKGQKGTPFSRCVKAMTRAGNNESMAPGQACKGFSKKHVKGAKGTPFSRCVKSVVQMRKEKRDLAQAAVV
jgi:hypothetical protein